MTGTKRSSEGLDVRRRRLLFRSWHRGTRELDFVFGKFADAQIGDLTDAEIDQYEKLLDLPDTNLQDWFVADVPVPEVHFTPIFTRVLAFRRTMTF